MRWCGEGGLLYLGHNTRRKVFYTYTRKEEPTSFYIANGLHHMAMSRYVYNGLPNCLPQEGENFRSQQRPLKAKIWNVLLTT